MMKAITKQPKGITKKYLLLCVVSVLLLVVLLPGCSYESHWERVITFNSGIGGGVKESETFEIKGSLLKIIWEADPDENPTVEMTIRIKDKENGSTRTLLDTSREVKYFTINPTTAAREEVAYPIRGEESCSVEPGEYCLVVCGPETSWSVRVEYLAVNKWRME